MKFKVSITFAVILIANIISLISIASPWIYAFGPPHGSPPHADLISSPSLIQVASDPSYDILYGVLIGFALGCIATFISAIDITNWRRLKKILLITLLASAFLFITISNFIFGNVYEQKQTFIINGKPVAYSIALGTGPRVAAVSSLFYIIAFIITVLTD
jgi:hypothetical protein